MVLDVNKFKTYNPGKDQFANMIAKLQLDDLPKKKKCKPKLSYLISTWNRKGQLARTLECLARQTFKEFEVLLMDDGSTENIKDVCEMFSSYLNIHYFHRERDEWRSCPSSSYKMMFPFADGDVIAITHPEMMLHPQATEYLYWLHYQKWDDVNYHYIIDQGTLDLFEEVEPKYDKSERFWVSLKSLFVMEHHYLFMDMYDWHSDIDNLRDLPDFMNTLGFAYKPNKWHEARKYYPWWFVASALRDDPIWADLPEFKGHAMIDMWFVDYRKKHKMIDVVPTKTLCYHQAHLTSAVAPSNERPEAK